MDSHAFFLQLQGADPQLPSSLASADLDAAQLDEPELALLKFAELLTKHAYRTTDADVEKLRSLGWTDPQIAECVYVAALFAFFNRVADAFGLQDEGKFLPPKDGPRARKGEP